jgi:hypothetical protein
MQATALRAGLVEDVLIVDVSSHAWRISLAWGNTACLCRFGLARNRMASMTGRRQQLYERLNSPTVKHSVSNNIFYAFALSPDAAKHSIL